MLKKYDHDEEIIALVSSFEEATIGRDDWKHAEHLVVALYYLIHNDYDTATLKMRNGLFTLLKKGFKVDLNKEMPYHETLTIFWMRTIAAFNASKKGSSLVDKANEITTTYDKDYPLRFYTREYLFSDEARAAFVEPDLELIDWVPV